MQLGMIGLGRMGANMVRRDNDEFANKLLSAMRYCLGGHVEQPEQKPGEQSS